LLTEDSFSSEDDEKFVSHWT